MALNDLLKQESLEDEGGWVELPGGGEAHIAFAGNPEFAKKQRRLERMHRKRERVRDGKEISDEAKEEIFREAMIGTLLKGIRGVYETSKSKEPLESTEENLRAVLESRKIRSFILRCVADEETFQEENMELVAKN